MSDRSRAARARRLREPPFRHGEASASLPAVAEPVFVGRRRELAALDRAIERAARGQGGLIVIDAPSGLGKTRLLDEVAERAGHRGVWTLRAAGAGEGSQRPLRGLDGLVASLEERLRGDPLLRSRMAAAVRAHEAALVGLFPVLAALLVDEGDAARGEARPCTAATAPEASPSETLDGFAEERALNALAALVLATAEAGAGAVLLLDDVQWADELTIGLLARWARCAATAPRAPLVLAAFRTGDGGSALRPQALPDAARLSLAPLPDEDAERLVASMVGLVPVEVQHLIARLADGSPLLLRYVLEGLIETEALVPGALGWRLDRSRLEDAQTSSRAARLLEGCLDRLPPATARLLAAAAVLGRRFDLAFAAEVAALPLASAATAARDARRRHLLLGPTSDEGALSFAHERLREALLSRLGPDERRALHRVAARAWERSAREQSAYELAHHLVEAGELERAFPHALAAADDALRHASFRSAAALYEIARRCAEAASASDPVRVRIALGLADALVRTSSYEDAERAIASARALPLTPGERATLETKAGELEVRRGSKAAVEPLVRALELLGRPPPRRFAGFVAAFAREWLAQALHVCLPRLFVGRRPLARADADLAAVRLYYQLGSAYFFAGSAVRSTWAMLRALNLAERYPASPRRSQCMAAWAIGLTTVPALWLARRYAARAVADQETSSDAWTTGVVRYAAGVVAFLAGRFREALAAFARARPLLERSGDVGTARELRHMEGQCALALGEVGPCVEAVRAGYFEARAAGEARNAAVLHELWQRASAGAAPPAPPDLDVAGDDVTRAFVRQGEAVRLLAAGRAAEAAAILEEVRAIFPWGNRTFAAAIPPWQATAIRSQLERLPALAQKSRADLERAHARACREALRSARTFANMRAHALRERGLGEALRGSYARARRTLEASLAAAARREQRLEEALTRLALARVARVAGWPEADALWRAADRDLATLRASAHAVLVDPDATAPPARPPSPALADRFAQLLACGRRLAAARSEESVLEALEEAAGSLFRGERVAVLASDGASAPAASLRVLCGDPGCGSGAFDALARRAFAQGAPVIDGDEADAGAAGEPAPSAAKRPSVLCAPILVRGRARACLVVVHGRVERLFGEGERRLAGFVVALAGAALDNALALAECAREEAEVRRLGEALARGQEDERRRLALALHDGAGQVLALLAIQLERDAQREADAGRRGDLARRVDLVNGLAQDLRQLSHDLRPATLERLGLSAALRELTEQTAAAGLPARCTVEPPDLDVPGEVAVHLYRVAQAAVANAVRHAEASRIDVRLERQPDAIALTIEDDGRGVDEAARGEGMSLGIVGMRERAAWLGGRFTLRTAPGAGTVVTVTVPDAWRR